MRLNVIELGQSEIEGSDKKFALSNISSLFNLSVTQTEATEKVPMIFCQFFFRTHIQHFVLSKFQSFALKKNLIFLRQLRSVIKGWEKTFEISRISSSESST